MDYRRFVSRLGFAVMIGAWASLALTGCSQEENLEADPGVSPFYPGPSAPKTATIHSEKGAQAGNVSTGRESRTGEAAGPGPADSPKIDARFGTNEVERQLRVALRTAQKGDPAVAAELLDKVLAIEPINREALLGRASLALKQANAAKAIDDRAAAIDKAVGLIRSLMHAYDTLKPHEVDFVKRAALRQARRSWCEQGRIDEAVISLKEANDLGFDAFGRVETDASLAALRSSPQYKAAHEGRRGR